jgi:hypothetical protein
MKVQHLSINCDIFYCAHFGILRVKTFLCHLINAKKKMAQLNTNASLASKISLTFKCTPKELVTCIVTQVAGFCVRVKRQVWSEFESHAKNIFLVG